MYRNPICDRCGTPIDFDSEAQDTGSVFRIDITDIDGRRYGLDLHKHCSREVKKEWEARVRLTMGNPLSDPRAMTPEQHREMIQGEL